MPSQVCLQLDYGVVLVADSDFAEGVAKGL
jgi:hypothetical protein